MVISSVIIINKNHFWVARLLLIKSLLKIMGFFFSAEQTDKDIESSAVANIIKLLINVFLSKRSLRGEVTQ